MFKSFGVGSLAILALAPVLSGQSAGPDTVLARRLVLGDGPKRLTEWTPYPVTRVDSFPNIPKVPLDHYGGRADRHADRTGFYHTAKLDGRWWIVDPDGNLYLSDGVNSVAPGKSQMTQAAFTRKFGNDGRWTEETIRQLRAMGVNSLGSWSDIDAFHRSALEKTSSLSYTVNLNVMAAYGAKHGGTHMGSGHLDYPDDTTFVFEADFERFAQDFLRKVESQKDDPNLLGYFSDNEIPLTTKNLDALLQRAERDPGHQAAAKWMKEHNATEPTDDLRSAFLEFEASRYFEVVSKALRLHDPNHMYLGCRFYSRQLRQPEMFRAAGKYADVVSVNLYGRWQADPEATAMWEREAGKPFLISEFYVKADNSGILNMAGAGWVVHTQDDRGLFYQNMVISLLRTRGCVGWHWFKYQDDDVSGAASASPDRGSNKGMLNAAYEPYAALLERMRAMNQSIYGVTDALDLSSSNSVSAKPTH